MKRTLLVDQGNSRLKMAWRQGEGIDSLFSMGDVEAALAAIEPAPDQVWVSSVAEPARRLHLVQQLEARWGCPCLLANVPAHQHHLPTRYAQDQLGVDRWLALLACRSPGRLPCLVVDCGTAITVDLLDADGVHPGGYILPGLALMRDSLLEGTAIPVPFGDRNDEPPARDTSSAIDLGARLGVVAFIEQQLQQLGPKAHLYMGGGDAEQVSCRLGVAHDIVEQMVLLGLSRLSLLEED